MSKVKIYGNPNPVIGIKEYYSIHDFFGSSAPSKFIEPLENIPDENIKWSVWILLGNEWTKMTKNNKTGATVEYTFTQTSLKRKGIRMLVDANGEKAVLDIKTKSNAESKILHVEILDNLGKKPTELFSYGETITARVHCLNMEKFRINVTLWENDGGKKDLSDISIETKEANVLNGIADVKFTFDPSKVWLANAKTAPNESNEGTFHEYYVTAEFYKKVSKPTQDINVINPDYKVDILSITSASKPSETETKKTSPREQKGPSKKETRGIAKKDEKAHDYQEQKVDVQPTITYNPQQEFINSLMMVNVGDSMWNQKKCDCKNYDLIWGSKVSCEFRKKVIEISERQNIDPNNFMAAMAHETGGTFDPTCGTFKRHKDEDKEGYVGLLQIGKDAAKDIGITRTELLKLNPEEQLNWMEKYLTRPLVKGKLNTLTDFYLAILFPVDCGKGSQPNTVVFDNTLIITYDSVGKPIKNLNYWRHVGYSANPSFHKEGDREIGKTYIWEIAQNIKVWYEKGKLHEVKTFSCQKTEEISKTPFMDSETWNVIITEYYTGQRCTHVERTAIRRNCRRGKIEVYDHNKNVVLSISDCLLEGTSGENRLITDGDAPFGVYRINSEPFIQGSASGEKRTAYGPNPRLFFEPINGSGDEADRSGRSLIRIHGGRQETRLFQPRTTPDLLRTHGCIRVWDADAKRLYDWWIEYHNEYPNIKPGKLKIQK
jgi:hypothetical protein